MATSADGAVDFGAFDALTFDCYGTLVDWESGLTAAFGDVLGEGPGVDNERLLESFGRHESAVEGGPYLRYREVLAETLRRMGAELGFPVSDEAAARFGGSVADWLPFSDSPEALRRLHERYRLAVITNCDDDLFAASQARLGITFDAVITAQQAESYKPNHRNFELAFERLGLPRNRILHVAQSLFHDHVPAKELGLTTVWVNRRGDRPGGGATRPATVTPDLTVADMRTLADLAAPPA